MFLTLNVKGSEFDFTKYTLDMGSESSSASSTRSEGFLSGERVPAIGSRKIWTDALLLKSFLVWLGSGFLNIGKNYFGFGRCGHASLGNFGMF
jgi:hypothetical protein